MPPLNSTVLPATNMNKGYHKRSICFGLFSSPVGIAIGMYINKTSIGDYTEFSYYSAAASLVAPYITWLLIVERKKRYSKIRSFLAGGLGAAFAHYLCWYFAIITANIQYWCFGIQIGSLSGPPIDPLFGLIAVLLYTFVSFIFIGWLTIPLGSVLGLIYRFILSKSNK